MNIHATASNRDYAKFEKLRDNFEWFYAHKGRLQRDYKNQYVAIKEKRPVDNDYDFERLLRRLNLYNCDESIAIEHVDN
jgi:uncharacterized protein DUF5678